MKTVKFKDCVFLVDYNATVEGFNLIDSGDRLECECEDCIRFTNNLEDIYPREVLNFFSELGIDYRKETKLFFDGEFESGHFCYNGFFNFIGNIAVDNCIKKRTSENFVRELISVTNNFKVGFSNEIFNNEVNRVRIDFLVINLKMN